MTKIRKSDRIQRKLGADCWHMIRGDLVPKLSKDDDPALWEFALSTILGRTRADASLYAGKEAIIVQIGRCSHWIRPKWKTQSGMTWPMGYTPLAKSGGWAGNFRSLPAFDGSLKWRLDSESGQLEPVRGQPTRRPLCHRICIPARTSRHPQATVHTIWTPGSPDDSNRKWVILYGFERTERGWRCFTQWEGERGARIS